MEEFLSQEGNEGLVDVVVAKKNFQPSFNFCSVLPATHLQFFHYQINYRGKCARACSILSFVMCVGVLRNVVGCGIS